MKKICPNCGAQNDKNTLYCSKCGNDIGLIKLKKVNRKFSILIGTIICLILVVLVVLVIKLSNPILRLGYAIDDNNENKIISIYRCDIRGKEKYKDDLKELLDNKLEMIQDEYINKGADYGDTKERLRILNNISELSLQIRSVNDKVEETEKYRSMLKSAKHNIDNKEYINAFDCLENISKGSDEYEEAKVLINDYKDEYEEQILSNVNECVAKQYYNDALQLLEEANSLVDSDRIRKSIDDIKLKQEIKKNTANLNLKYRVNESDEELNNIYLQNGQGEIKFACTTPKNDILLGIYRKVENYIPFTTVNFVLENSGEEAVINPKIEISFSKMSIKNPSAQNWVPENPMHGWGTYAGAKWTGENVQNGSPVKFSLNFCDAYIWDGASMTIIISGDNVSAQSYNIPVSYR